MNTRILNRAEKLPEDGFYQIEAVGEHINHASKVVQLIDAKAVESIVNRFNAAAAKAGEEYPGQRIDRDHLSQSLENPTEALGWAMQLRNREGIPEAKIDWTGLGRPLIESKPGQPPVYKFFSTEYEPAECERIGTRIVNRKTYELVRPLQLAGLSLTNDPNNKGQRPISNRNGNDAGAAENQPEKPTMKQVIKLLGLADDASEDSAVAALQKIQNRASQVEALTTERDTLLAAQVESDLTAHAAVISNREVVKAQLIANRTGTLALLASLKMPAAAKEDAARITNRGSARTPEQIEAGKAADQDKARGAKIRNRAAELRQITPSLSRSAAFANAEAELDAK
ncbi:MAG: hypothetical protein HY302_10515 [Opitutae bacterium]|nr:hypothetical protein [Opitutae bacterium]